TALLGLLRSRTGEMVARTAALAAIDSGADAPAGVDRVGGAVAEWLAGAGFATARESLDGCGAMLAATLALGPGPVVVIVGHADTVWPAGTAAEWQVRCEEGMLSGPGVGDMKGCLVMAVEAVAAARAAGGLDGIGSLIVLIVPDEERGSVGSR